jgi:hypothetical protein
VTADSVYISENAPGVSNCLYGLVDGKIAPNPFTEPFKCCAMSNVFWPNNSGYFRIDMGTTRAIYDVLLIANNYYYS